MGRAGCVKSTKVVQVHIRRSQIFQYLVLILIWMELMLESGRDTHLISPTDAQFRKQDIFESLKNQDVIYYMHRLTICDSRWYSSNQVKPILKRGFQNGNGQTTTNNAPYLSLQLKANKNSPAHTKSVRQISSVCVRTQMVWYIMMLMSLFTFSSLAQNPSTVTKQTETCSKKTGPFWWWNGKDQEQCLHEAPSYTWSKSSRKRKGLWMKTGIHHDMRISVEV